jgi:hypothetical protein
LKPRVSRLKKNNPEVVPTDPDASWGYSETKGFIYGYKLHLASTVGKVIIPLSFEVTGANSHDSTQFETLTKGLKGTKHFLS